MANRTGEVAVVDNATRAWDMVFYGIPYERGDWSSPLVPMARAGTVRASAHHYDTLDSIVRLTHARRGPNVAV